MTRTRLGIGRLNSNEWNRDQKVQKTIDLSWVTFDHIGCWHSLLFGIMWISIWVILRQPECVSKTHKHEVYNIKKRDKIMNIC